MKEGTNSVLRELGGIYLISGLMLLCFCGCRATSGGYVIDVDYPKKASVSSIGKYDNVKRDADSEDILLEDKENVLKQRIQELNKQIEAQELLITSLNKKLKEMNSRINAADGKLRYLDIKKMHEVTKGESLWKIAGQDDIYGDPYKWVKIYSANRDIIADPNLIYPGQILVIPDKVK